MTEDEAKTKWCPQFQVSIAGGPAGQMQRDTWRDKSNRPLEGGGKCLASACMAFRWLPDATWSGKHGHVCIVDNEDAEILVGSWFDGRYFKSDLGYIHRLIAEAEHGFIPEDMFVDHIDGDPLNNRRGNLRVVTKAQNAANAKSRGGASQYRGVYKARSGKWAAQIAKEGQRISLGHYETEEEAAAAYDEAAKELHGEYARLNLVIIKNSGRQGFCGLAGRP
jgi:hypothetical protein